VSAIDSRLRVSVPAGFSRGRGPVETAVFVHGGPPQTRVVQHHLPTFGGVTEGFVGVKIAPDVEARSSLIQVQTGTLDEGKSGKVFVFNSLPIQNGAII